MSIALERRTPIGAQEASLEHVRIWRSANRLFPQSQNGFAAILGPHIIFDLFNQRLHLSSMLDTLIPNIEMEDIIEEAATVHEKLDISCEISAGSVLQQWRATGTRIQAVLDCQIQEIASGQNDHELISAPHNPIFPKNRFSLFILDNKHLKNRELVQNMWNIAADTLLSSSAKHHAAVISRTLVAMHTDMRAGRTALDLRQGSIIKPEWEEIRYMLVNNLYTRLDKQLGFDPLYLVERFVNILIQGNKPQSATRKKV